IVNHGQTSRTCIGHYFKCLEAVGTSIVLWGKPRQLLCELIAKGGLTVTRSACKDNRFEFAGVKRETVS
ncbi:MAG: hypothetical protein PHD01_05895, partial [Geobacteraceae bacterium]|nr:hypothetical protein [Geobacteraceae bacterium]